MPEGVTKACEVTYSLVVASAGFVIICLVNPCSTTRPYTATSMCDPPGLCNTLCKYTRLCATKGKAFKSQVRKSIVLTCPDLIKC